MSGEKIFIEVTRYKRGQTIFREGDPGSCMYVVETGKVGIYAGFGGPNERLLKVLEAGSFFGEMGMVRGMTRSATAAALDDTGVSAVTWETLGRYFRESPAKIVAIMQQMGQRLNELSDDYVDACGAIVELVEERNTLRAENSVLRRKLERVRKVETDENGEPVWRRRAGADDESEDARFRKYMDAYQKYKRKHR